MKGATEKLSVKIKESGRVTITRRRTRMEFTALEALMLLDILENEKNNLRKAADKEAPTPIRIGI